jgi:DNA polymerase IIIc chi subunit
LGHRYAITVDLLLYSLVLLARDFIAHDLLNSAFDQEKPVTVKYTEHDPTDTTVLVFWLKNRQRGRWRDKVEPETVVSNDFIAELDAARERARNYARVRG